MTIDYAINALVAYGLENQMIDKMDTDYSKNKLLKIFDLPEISDEIIEMPINIHEVTEAMCNYAVSKGIIEEDLISLRDCFDSYVMDTIMPRPSELNNIFLKKYEESPIKATEYFYELSKKSQYIRMTRINKNIIWKSEVNGNVLDLTINLSKPEKDPKQIALEKFKKDKKYPKCLLCKENVGYYGSITHPGRSNHRIIPLTLDNEAWALQYSPYSYFNEHCICLKQSHDPMSIKRETFVRLLDFVTIFPHYFLGSNADLPIVGGSILAHDHFQGGNFEFAMARAKSYYDFEVEEFSDVKCFLVNWPMSVIRLNSTNKDSLVNLATQILEKWRGYSDLDVDIKAQSNGEPHNTITPISRINKNGLFELDLVLRNNRTSKEHPLGIFHPHSDVHHIKKENIGLIEVMGLAVLPARLKDELIAIESILITNKIEELPENLLKHKEWILIMLSEHEFNKENVSDIVRLEVAKKFNKCLVDAGVYKQDSEGVEHFKKFVQTL